jgi:hypothetical protein
LEPRLLYYVGGDVENWILASTGHQLTMYGTYADDSRKWRPLFGKEYVCSEYYELTCDLNQLLNLCTATPRFSINVSHWLEWLLQVGRQYTDLLLSVKELIYANPENYSNGDDQVSPLYAFCSQFSVLELQIETCIQSRKRAEP